MERGAARRERCASRWESPRPPDPLQSPLSCGLIRHSLYTALRGRRRSERTSGASSRRGRAGRPEGRHKAGSAGRRPLADPTRIRGASPRQPAFEVSISEPTRGRFLSTHGSRPLAFLSPLIHFDSTHYPRERFVIGLTRVTQSSRIDYYGNTHTQAGGPTGGKRTQERARGVAHRTRGGGSAPLTVDSAQSNIINQPPLVIKWHTLRRRLRPRMRARARRRGGANGTRGYVRPPSPASTSAARQMTHTMKGVESPAQNDTQKRMMGKKKSFVSARRRAATATRRGSAPHPRRIAYPRRTLLT
jgi:hypothetical protein